MGADQGQRAAILLLRPRSALPLCRQPGRPYDRWLSCRTRRQAVACPDQGEGWQPGLHRLQRSGLMSKTYGFETLSIHAGAAPDPTTGARALPIYQTTAYAFEDADHAAALFNLQTVGFIYSRLTNPTNAALETRLATLEGGRGCTVTASGHSAQVLALFPLMAPGDEIVASSRLYGGSLQQMRNTYPKFGWAAKIVDADTHENFQRALTDTTKAFFIESLANPGGVISDLEAIARIADDAGIP